MILILTGMLAGAGCRSHFSGAAEAPPRIVISADAPRSVRLAAQELQDCLARAGAARSPIVSDSELAAVNGDILLGDNRFSRALGYDPASLSEQQFLIASTPNALILLGHDDPDDAEAEIVGESWHENKYFVATGTLQAAYRFLEEFVGYRWYWPGELGEVVPVNPDWQVPYGQYHYQPRMGFRSMFAYWHAPAALWSYPRSNAFQYPEERLDAKYLERWGRQLLLGGEQFTCNHNQYNYFQRFGEEHPEWFANNNPQAGNQLCYSNPEVLAQVVADARDFFDGTLHARWNIGDYYSVMPSDTKSWCQCDLCAPQYDKSLLTSDFCNGHVSEYVWNFVVKVANEVKKTHPDKSIACGAYWEYFLPPAIEIPDNVAVMICKPRKKFYDPAYEAFIDNAVEAWSRKTKRVYFWDYYLFPASPGYESYPQIDPRHIAREIRKMDKLGLHGGMMMQMDEVYLRNPIYDHLRIYVSMKMMENPDLDVDVLLEEYYRLFYGDAAAAMAEFFTRLEDIYYAPRPPSDTFSEAEYDWNLVAPKETVAALGELLRQAGEAVPRDSVFRRRIDLVEAGIWQCAIADSSRIVLERLKNKRHIAIPRLPEAPKIDGVREALWDRAAVADQWTAADSGTLQQPTLAYIGYDDENLYVFFDCRDEKDYCPEPLFKEYKGQVYLDDSVEVFVDVGCTRKENGYKHFVINAHPTLFEDNMAPDTHLWQSGSRFAATREPGRWSVEIAIPLAALGVSAIEEGSVWGINFCRNLSESRSKGLGSRFMNWSGPSGYHTPGRFGIATFQ